MANPFIGEVIMFGGNFAPRGWALCNGQLLAISSNQALFSILGTTYGGDGRTTFALPELRGRVPVGTGQGPGLSNRPLGQRTGQQGVSLQPSQMPAHTHVGDVSGLSAQLQGDTGNEANTGQPAPANVLSKLASPINVLAYSDSDANLTEIGGSAPINPTIANTGNGQSHENRQPLLAINYIIALVGVFPSRN